MLKNLKRNAEAHIAWAITAALIWVMTEVGWKEAVPYFLMLVIGIVIGICLNAMATEDSDG